MGKKLRFNDSRKNKEYPIDTNWLFREVYAKQLRPKDIRRADLEIAAAQLKMREGIEYEIRRQANNLLYLTDQLAKKEPVPDRITRGVLDDVISKLERIREEL